MDELVIDEKRYISSKRAASITGYAKDYIGQLCREGRLPARLVGRNWYVLESAVRDHRFGDGDKREEKDVPHAPPVFSSAWESPRYEAAETEVLPTTQHAEEEPNVLLQDSWREWFARIADRPAPVVIEEPLQQVKQEQETEKAPKGEELTGEEVKVPIRTLYRHPPKELLPGYFEPKINEKRTEEPKVSQKRTKKNKTILVIQATGGVLAVVIAILAIIGTGHFDQYIIPHSQVSLLAGIVTYQK